MDNQNTDDGRRAWGTGGRNLILQGRELLVLGFTQVASGTYEGACLVNVQLAEMIGRQYSPETIAALLEGAKEALLRLQEAMTGVSN